MKDNQETPERKRERLRQQELKSNPTGNMNDAYNRTNSGNLADLVGSLGWKGMRVLILVIVIAFIIISLYFK
ncbi:DUF6366 family protein [Neobacillus fumarioli]|uniref:DUF6366 family protein n=1 Tax=Neobacillus fumarioli TaxID=105229 RepID=UPI00082B212A|nr:DUF6366 family protein [Neobacillus fumarioli]